MVKLLFLKAVSQSPFLSSVPKYFDKTQRNAQNGKAGVLACSYSDLTEATLVGRGLKKRSQLPGSPCWVCKYKKPNGNLQPVRVHGRKRSQSGICSPTTCSAVCLMGHCLGNVRHPEAAGKLMGEGLSPGTGRHMPVQFAQRLSRDQHVC